MQDLLYKSPSICRGARAKVHTYEPLTHKRLISLGFFFPVYFSSSKHFLLTYFAAATVAGGAGFYSIFLGGVAVFQCIDVNKRTSLL